MTRRVCTAMLLPMIGMLWILGGASSGDEIAESQYTRPSYREVDLDLTDDELLEAIHASVIEQAVDADTSAARRDQAEYADEDGPLAAPILVPGARKLSFQAALTDTNGDALIGATVDLVFRIYDGTTHGLVEGPITMNGVSMTDGIVDTQIPINGSSFNGRALELGLTVNGDSVSPRIPLTSVPYALRVDRVASEELDDNIDMGSATESGRLRLYDSVGNRSIALYGSGGTVEASGSVIVTDVSGDTYGRFSENSNGGELYLWDKLLNPAVRITGNPLTGGGYAEYYQGNGPVGVSIVGDALFGSWITLHNEAGGTTINLDSDNNSGSGSIGVGSGGASSVYLSAADRKVSLRNDNAKEVAVLHARSYGDEQYYGELKLRDESMTDNWTAFLTGTNSGGELTLYQANGTHIGVRLDGDGSPVGGTATWYGVGGTARVTARGGMSGSGGLVTVRDTSGTETIRLLGSENGSDGGQLELRQANNRETIVLDAQNSTGGPLITLYDQSSVNTIMIDGQDDETGGGRISVRNAAGTTNIKIEALDDDGLGGGNIRVRDNGLTRVLIDGKDGTAGGGSIRLYDNNGNRTITIDANYAGEGRIITDVLQITGGADLSERFDIASTSGLVEPGMLVSIDPVNPGKLVVSTRQYDSTVAGIVSGAGGVKPGMLMGQSDTAADGAYPVALSGRVYCFVDAGYGAVKPGDMITTSDTPGHGMKVTNRDRAHGTVIGKAMSSLDAGRGLVLVLVNLQ